jgi:hypothetical protein
MSSKSQAHACNLSYLGGEYKIESSKLTRAKVASRLCLKNK